MQAICKVIIMFECYRFAIHTLKIILVDKISLINKPLFQIYISPSCSSHFPKFRSNLSKSAHQTFLSIPFANLICILFCKDLFYTKKSIYPPEIVRFGALKDFLQSVPIQDNDAENCCNKNIPEQNSKNYFCRSYIQAKYVQKSRQMGE